MTEEGTRARTVFLAGASGFIGRHLHPALEAAGFSLRCGTRDVERARAGDPHKHWVRFDVEDRASLLPALEGCDALVYLVHQMGGGEGYAEREKQAALWLSEVAEQAGVRRIVYLGGVAPQGECSPHLRSRLDTGHTLREGSVPCIELRAGMIVGHGSASWLIVRDLAERLPAMVLPKWLQNRSSPVAIDDVVRALCWATTCAPAQSAWYDVPGAELLSHRDVLSRVAQVLGKHPTFVEVPVVTPQLSSYWIALVTRTGLSLARELVQGLQADLVPLGASVWELTAHAPLGLEEAAKVALMDEGVRPHAQPTAEARMRAIGLSVCGGAAS